MAKRRKTKKHKYTQGPWAFAFTESLGERLTVFKGNAPGLIMVADGLSLEDAYRIMDCVNACEGITDPAAFIERAKADATKYFVDSSKAIN